MRGPGMNEREDLEAIRELLDAYLEQGVSETRTLSRIARIVYKPKQALKGDGDE